MKNARKLAALVAIAMITLVATAVNATEGVSPGAGDRLAVIRDNCPTFSWGEVDDAASYEVVAYRLPKNEDSIGSAQVELSKENEVLYTRVAGAATAWTPSLERCFLSGGSYVWFVRAVFDEDGTPTAGDWSEGLYFSVVAAPSAEEVRQALGVLQRYLEEGGGGNEELAAITSGSGSGGGAPQTTRNAGTIKVAGRALPGTAAIRGEQPDPTGETLGVYGISNSSTNGSFGVAGESTAATGEAYGVGGITASVDGAGVIAFNASNGTDLILGADSYSAHLTEMGITRSLPGPATFDIDNPDGAGSMTLRVDGVEVVTTATDRDALGGLSCMSGELTKWNGSQWVCAPDADSTYSNGFGLGLIGDTVFYVDQTAIQRRVVTPCTPGQSIRVINQDGSVVCEVDDGTTYSAGNQLDLVGTTFNVLEGSGSGLDADTLDSHNTDYFATSVHDHLGQTWTGSAPHGLKVENSAPGVTYGVYGNSSSADGYGGFFENTAGGVDIMAGGSGDIAQTLEGSGLVKAAAFVSCLSTPTIHRSFNKVPGAGPISITRSGTGACEIEFGFDLTDRFWSATSDFLIIPIQCTNGLGSVVSDLYCSAPQDYSAMILVY